jgi:uncharacterized protein (DUF58 family)
MAEVAAIIAFSAIANHDKVGLLLFSSEVEHYIPPKRGMKHGVRIIRDIMETKPKKQGTSIAEALRFLTSVTSKRCIAFLISDFEDTAYEQDFTITAKKNDLVAIKITDPQEEEPFPLGLVRMKELEGKEREEIIDFNNDAVGAFIKKREEANIFFHTLIGKSGADSIELTTKGDIHVPLRAFFARRKKRL